MFNEWRHGDAEGAEVNQEHELRMNWGKCYMGRRPVQIMVIEGEERKGARPRQEGKDGVKKSTDYWAKKWSEWNQCGESQGQISGSADGIV